MRLGLRDAWLVAIHESDTPKAGDPTDRFEYVDELILCGRGEWGGRLGESGLDVPCSCCMGHFQRMKGVNRFEPMLSEERAQGIGHHQRVPAKAMDYHIGNVWRPTSCASGTDSEFVSNP